MANSVQKLQSIEFSKLTLKQKIAIKELGRPTPPLKLSQIRTEVKRTYIRTFKSATYQQFSWICGCDVTNAFYCFPCLLYGKDAMWTKNGCRDLTHLQLKAKKHANSSSHISAQIDFKLLGKSEISSPLGHDERTRIRIHNDQVTKNRHILSKYINALLFCGKFELSQGVYQGLMNYSADVDDALRILSGSALLRGTPEDIQNELLDCILAACRKQIVKEVNNNVISIMSDDTTDVSALARRVLVIRYVYISEPVERFWSFSNPPLYNSKEIATEINTTLKEIINDPEKLISQSYDGAAVMVGVERTIKQLYPNAELIHCYAHQLSFIIFQALSHSTQLRIFFMNLSAFPVFFAESPQRRAVLSEVIRRRRRLTISTQWNLSRTVSTIYDNREDLIECLETLSITTMQISTVTQAQALLKFLEDPVFTYWLSVFHLIMPHVTTLYQKMQTKSLDKDKVGFYLKEFEEAILEVRNGKIDKLKKPPLNNGHAYPKIDYSAEAKNVCDIVVADLKPRFNYTKHLNAAALLESEKFGAFNRQFPKKKFKEVVCTYSVLNSTRLQTELEILYSREHLRTIRGPALLLRFISSNELLNVFEEVVKLITIVLTIPMATVEKERRFSTLRRAKTFLRGNVREDRLSALGMISIENEWISKIPGFNDLVIEEFCARNNSAEFQYQK